MVFHDRHQAGQALGEVLHHKYSGNNTVVLALPKGGVPVGYEIARKLHAPFDVVISKKLGAPHHPEFGVGAVAEEGVLLIDEPTVSLFRLKHKDLEEQVTKEEMEIKRMRTLYRQNNYLPDLSGKIVIVVDDGLATGITAKAALEVVEKHHPEVVIFAAPICELETAKLIDKLVDDTVCLNSQIEIQAVSLWYQDFTQVNDEAVLSLLHEYPLSYLFS